MPESTFSLWRDARSARKQGRAAVEMRQRARLAEMVAFARGNAPYYRSLYAGLPDRVEDAALLPITDKKALMASFDATLTDPEVTAAKVSAFVEDRSLIGQRFLGKYLAATTSGTSGYRGMFVFDDRHLAVAKVMMLRMLAEWLSFWDLLKIILGGAREAQVIATDGHYIAIGGGKQAGGWHSRTHRTFSITTPIPELVAQLNALRPAVLRGYASVVSMLASEQRLGRLCIHPVLVLPIAESLRAEEEARIEVAFGSKVRNMYGSTECGIAAYSCTEGWYHVNADWIVLEPVDADYRPTSRGKPSYTVLVTNLVNRVQPILRYDLGDSVIERPDACPCGNPLQAIRVQGRSSEALRFPTSGGAEVLVPPLAAEIDVPDVELMQIVQVTPTTLRVRLKFAAGANGDQLWQLVHAKMAGLLSRYGLGEVRIERAEEAPVQSVGGKYRAVIPMELMTAGR